MKLSVFKEFIEDRAVILYSGLVHTFQKETAYWANNWTSLLSTFFYTIAMVVFIDVIYSNVTSVAGYTRNEMLLFLFIGQIGYYASWLIHYNLQELIKDVNEGNLDLLLVKPMPSLFYVTFKRVKLFSVLRDSVPPMVALWVVIDWGTLLVKPHLVLLGLFICSLGIITAHVVHFLATIPVFWLGESSNILDFSQHVEYNVGKTIPFEGYPYWFQLTFSVLIPVLISAGIASSVMLGKSQPVIMLVLSLLVTSAALYVRTFAWNRALRVYSSASS